MNVVKLHQRIIAFDFVSLAAGHIEGQRVNPEQYHASKPRSVI
jgi:hypothetical protein